MQELIITPELATYKNTKYPYQVIRVLDPRCSFEKVIRLNAEVTFLVFLDSYCEVVSVESVTCLSTERMLCVQLPRQTE